MWKRGELIIGVCMSGRVGGFPRILTDDCCEPTIPVTAGRDIGFGGFQADTSKRFGTKDSWKETGGSDDL